MNSFFETYFQAIQSYGCDGIDRHILLEIAISHARHNEGFSDGRIEDLEDLATVVKGDATSFDRAIRRLTDSGALEINGCNEFWFGPTIQQTATAIERRQEAQREASQQMRDGTISASASIRVRTVLHFAGCELCGEVAENGKDALGRQMVVSRIKTGKRPEAANVTLLCVSCRNHIKGQDLPSECRSLESIEVSKKRGYEVPPRTATKPTRTITVTGDFKIERVLP